MIYPNQLSKVTGIIAAYLLIAAATAGAEIMRASKGGLTYNVSARQDAYPLQELKDRLPQLDSKNESSAILPTANWSTNSDLPDNGSVAFDDSRDDMLNADDLTISGRQTDFTDVANRPHRRYRTALVESDVSRSGHLNGRPNVHNLLSVNIDDVFGVKPSSRQVGPPDGNARGSEGSGGLSVRLGREKRQSNVLERSDAIEDKKVRSLSEAELANDRVEEDKGKMADERQKANERQERNSGERLLEMDEDITDIQSEEDELNAFRRDSQVRDINYDYIFGKSNGEWNDESLEQVNFASCHSTTFAEL